jgi:hypothetical protein
VSEPEKRKSGKNIYFKFKKKTKTKTKTKGVIVISRKLNINT